MATDNPYLDLNPEEDALLADHRRRQAAALAVEANLQPSPQVKLIERERLRSPVPTVPTTYVQGLG